MSRKRTPRYPHWEHLNYLHTRLPWPFHEVLLRLGDTCIAFVHSIYAFASEGFEDPPTLYTKNKPHGAFQSLVHGSNMEKLHKPFGIQELIILNRPRKQKTHGANQRNSEKGNCSYLHGILGSACPFPKYLVCKMNMGNVVSIVADFVSGRQQHFC